MEKTADPYNYPFLKKQQTMYLSTISKNDFKPSNTQYYRDSSFQKKDIEGSNPKILIPPKPNDTTFSLSTFIEPKPDRAKHIQKVSDPLYRDDIDGAKPRKNEFRTNRVVDPLIPKYQLPSAAQISVDPGRKFLRDGLEISDINQKRKTNMGERGRDILKQPIQGSQPSKLTKLVKANSNLEVKDINKDGIFESNRSVNPLQPNYQWRDQDDKSLNSNYGKINGTNPRQVHPVTVNRPNNMCFDLNDIQGTKSNSTFAKAHFLDKRREFRNYMQTKDIEKAQSSTLKKGIDTKRAVNPLMPNYQYPGNSEVNK